MNQSNSDKKKLVYILVITFCTFVFMMFFKFSDDFNTHQIIQEFKDGYNTGRRIVQNLKPLETKTEISDEDAFNFAMYKNLPIDKENNKILQVGNDRSGDEFFELKKADYKETNNYEKFLTSIKAKDIHRKEIDSIIQFYKPQLYSSILVQEGNKIAVSPKLLHINEAMRTDLLKYSAPSFREDDRIAILERTKVLPRIKERIENLEKNFIFIDKDTSFNFEIEPEPDVLLTEKTETGSLKNTSVKAVSESYAEDNISVNLELNDAGFKIKIDSLQKNLFKLNISDEEFKVYIPDVDKQIIELAELEDSIEDVNEIFENFIFRMENKDDSSGNMFSIKIGKDKNSGVNFELNVSNINKLVGNSLQMISTYSEKDWEKFGVRMDSLAQAYEKHAQDSVRFDVEKFKKKLANKKKRREKLD
ncbi:MAG: hypothetical protein JEY94_16085 [Melioribacteraceae bacterium]|nr:hypothetical protein [Melioribacteraceae bacterium]